MAFAVGDVVMLHPADGASAVDNDATADGPLGLLQALWQTSTGVLSPSSELHIGIDGVNCMGIR